VGAGDVTLEIAGRVGATGRVVGIDMDEVKLDLARHDALAAGVTNVEFLRMSAYDWSQPDTYDLVYCRYFLQHLSRPVDMLRAMWAGLRPGGALVVEDVEISAAFCDPPERWHQFWLETYQAVLRSHGGDPTTGSQLHRLFIEAGVAAPLTVTLSQRADLADEFKHMPRLSLAAIAEAIVADGLATPEAVAEAVARLAEYADDPHTLIGSPRTFQVWTRKPAA